MASSKILVAPSILSCDFSHLADEIKAVENAGADWLHVDIMDGHFVDNLTVGPPVVSSVKKVTEIPLDVHLMIENPEKTIDRYVQAGANILTIHVEATKDVGAALKQIKKLGAKAGLTLRPQTPLKEIENYFALADLILVMTVNPGWGGQHFMADQLTKVKQLRQWADKNNPSLFIEVDGGINPDTAEQCRLAGANVFVAGSGIFKKSDYKKAITDIRG